MTEEQLYAIVLSIGTALTLIPITLIALRTANRWKHGSPNKTWTRSKRFTMHSYSSDHRLISRMRAKWRTK